MYLTIEPKQLKPAVVVAHAIAGSGNSMMPICKQFFLTASATGLSLCASDGDTSLQYRLAAQVQAPGRALLPAQLFAHLVAEVPAAPLTLILPSPTDPTAAQVRCLQIRANLKLGTMPVEEFPHVVCLDEGCRELFLIDAELLREVIDQVAFAAATTPTHPVLSGIRLALGQGQASFAAADTFRLAVRTIAIPDPTISVELVIPARAVRHLVRLLPASGAVQLALSSDGRQVLFHTPEMDLSTRLIEGTFPNYGGLLTAPVTTRLVARTAALADAVHLMAPFAREHKRQLCLQIQSPQHGKVACVFLEAEAPDLGTNEICLTEAVTVEGPDLCIQVNDHFLAEALAAVPTQEVALEFDGAARPIRIGPVGMPDSISVIMPLTTPTSSSPAPGTATGNAPAGART